MQHTGPIAVLINCTANQSNLLSRCQFSGMTPLGHWDSDARSHPYTQVLGECTGLNRCRDIQRHGLVVHVGGVSAAVGLLPLRQICSPYDIVFRPHEVLGHHARLNLASQFFKGPG